MNLNSFIIDINNSAFVQSARTIVNENGATGGVGGSASSEHGSIESAIKFDDCSTTDSGSALEEETSTCGPNGSTNEGGGGGSGGGGSCNTNDPDLQEDDEGIDMTSSTDNNKCGSACAESGPYNYELFAIMIHSGSASGGHYYAYIKDFESDDWYCFNDQTVSSVSSYFSFCIRQC